MSLQNITKPNNLEIYLNDIQFSNSNTPLTQYNQYSGTLSISGYTSPANASYYATRVGDIVCLSIQIVGGTMQSNSLITLDQLPTNLRPNYNLVFSYQAYDNLPSPTYFSGLCELSASGVLSLGDASGGNFTAGHICGPAASFFNAHISLSYICIPM